MGKNGQKTIIRRFNYQMQLYGLLNEETYFLDFQKLRARLKCIQYSCYGSFGFALLLLARL